MRFQKLNITGLSFKKKPSENESPEHYIPSTYKNEGFFSWPVILSYKGTVIPKIMLPVLIMTAFSSLITVLYKEFGYGLDISSSVLPSISVVVGLMLVFRTNTSYDRYYEGRRLWSDLSSCIQNLSRGIWLSISVNNDLERLEKIQTIKYLIALTIAIKHHLREEYGRKWNDLDYLLPPDFLTATPSPALTPLTATPSPTLTLITPISINTALQLQEDYNYPLLLTHKIHSYLVKCRKTDKTDTVTHNNMISVISQIISILNSLERILHTPIPFAYYTHMKQVIYVYCLILPFTSIKLGYIQIPIVFVISFMLFGILEIGDEIENPFGYDYNDLPLDEICKKIRKDIELFTPNNESCFRLSSDSNTVA